MNTDELDQAIKVYRDALQAVEQKRAALDHAERVAAIAAGKLDDLERQLAWTWLREHGARRG